MLSRPCVEALSEGSLPLCDGCISDGFNHLCKELRGALGRCRIPSLMFLTDLAAAGRCRLVTVSFISDPNPCNGGIFLLASPPPHTSALSTTPEGAKCAGQGAEIKALQSRRQQGGSEELEKQQNFFFFFFVLFLR